jgi:hypothetical protein
MFREEAMQYINDNGDTSVVSRGVTHTETIARARALSRSVKEKWMV